MAFIDQDARGDVRQRRAFQTMSALGAVHVHVGNETPAGAIDGTNVTFTLAFAPLASSLQLFLNGLLMAQTIDYTLSGFTLTYNAGQVPQAGDTMLAWYIKAG